MILFKKQKFHRDKQEEYIHSVPFFLKRKKNPCRIRKFFLFSFFRNYKKNNPCILHINIHNCPTTIQTGSIQFFFIYRATKKIQSKSIASPKIRQNFLCPKFQKHAYYSHGITRLFDRTERGRLNRTKPIRLLLSSLDPIIHGA